MAGMQSFHSSYPNVSINEICKSTVTFWVLFLISASGLNQTKGKTADQRDSKKS